MALKERYAVHGGGQMSACSSSTKKEKSSWVLSLCLLVLRSGIGEPVWNSSRGPWAKIPYSWQ